MDPSQIMLGKYSLPFVLSIVLGFIYKNTNIKDEFKPYIAAGCGMVLAVAAMFYNEGFTSINFQIVLDYVLEGMIGGAAATGIYEMNKQGPAGRFYVAVDKDGKRIDGAKVKRFNKPKILN